MIKPIYLDYNATTPVDPRVAEAMMPYLTEQFGNPSSSHYYGRQTRAAVEEARAQVAAMLDCQSEEVIFTSGGSESNNYAIKGAVATRREQGNHVITSSVEHPAVTEVCHYLEENDYRVTYLPVDRYGMIDPASVEKAITDKTVLISIMHANNEVGTVEPIARIAEIAHRHDIIVHSDSAQSVGKIPVRVDDLGIDLLSIAGHKLYAPKGIGALYIRSGIVLEKQIHGANHEMNYRAGTENVLEIVGLGAACAIIASETDEEIRGLRALRDRLEVGLLKIVSTAHINGHPAERLPNTCSISFPGVDAGLLLSKLTGIAASAGAACHSDGIEMSSVLRAMEVPERFAMGTIRFSVGRFTTEEDIDKALTEIESAFGDL